MEGFLHYRFGGLIHGGAYFWTFTYAKRPNHIFATYDVLNLENIENNFFNFNVVFFLIL